MLRGRYYFESSTPLIYYTRRQKYFDNHETFSDQKFLRMRTFLIFGNDLAARREIVPKRNGSQEKTPKAKSVAISLRVAAQSFDDPFAVERSEKESQAGTALLAE